MTDHPDRPDDRDDPPRGDEGGDQDGPQLPPELREMFEQLGLEPGAGDLAGPDPADDPVVEPGRGPAGLPPQLQGLFEQLGLTGADGELPPQLRQMFDQLSTPEGMADLQRQAAAMFGGAGGPFAGGSPFAAFGPGAGDAGPVDWELATRVALQVAAEDDRGPRAEEAARAEEAFRLAEHWLDATSLPAAPDAGRVRISSRQEWVNAAVTAMRPLVDPVAKASTDAMVELAREQLGGLLDGGELPEELAPLRGVLDQLAGDDPGAMFRPVGAMLAGLQVGQVLGQLARTLLGQYDLSIPTAPRAEAHLVAVNVADAFDGWDLDVTEVAIVVALHESALRRLYHAVPWLEAHVQSLVARFATGTVIDTARLEELSRELLAGVDPDDPESLEAAMEHAAGFRLEPTDDQRRILERLQGVVCLVGAWARHEVARAADGRLTSLPRIAEVQRRRRAERGGDGDDLLAGLLGLDLQPDDEAAGERFVAAVEEAVGTEGLRRALEHPENLPDAAELVDPSRWLARMAADGDVPDDPSALFADLGDAPVEASADERVAERERDDEGDGDGDDGDGDGDE